MEIDTTFDFRSDTPPGGDPDRYSATLKRYHQVLWSRPLPNGRPFELSSSVPGVYLHHASDLGNFRLSSDAVMPSYSRWDEMAPIVSQLPDAEVEAFVAATYTIGGMMIFPGNQIDGRWTINQARGCLSKISDRFDLTVEAIRRHYRDEPSPLGETFARYPEYFALFGDFGGFVEHFLLQDLVDHDGSVRFFMDFDDFRVKDVPREVETYLEFRNRSLEFIASRNRRIAGLGL